MPSGTGRDMLVHAEAVLWGSLLHSPNDNTRAGASACPRAGDQRHLVSSTVFACSCKLRLWQGAALRGERRLPLRKRGSPPRRTHCWVFPWDCETGPSGAEGAATEDQTSEGTKCDTGQKVSATVPVQVTTNLQVIQTKVTNSEFYS